MRVGVKIGPMNSEEYIEEISPYADFFEVYALPGYDCDFLLKYKKPVVIHLPHFRQKYNLCNPARKEKSLEALHWAVKLADKFKSDKIVFHADMKEDENCTLGNLNSFIKENFDSRLMIENVPPASWGFEHVCRTPEEIAEVMKATGVKFCFDFAHAAEYAVANKLEIKPFFKKFLALKPSYFHVTDTPLDKDGKSWHLNLGEGKLDLGLVKKLIPKDSWIAIETPGVAEKQKKEIAFLKE